MNNHERYFIRFFVLLFVFAVGFFVWGDKQSMSKPVEKASNLNIGIISESDLRDLVDESYALEGYYAEGF